MSLSLFQYLVARSFVIDDLEQEITHNYDSYSLLFKLWNCNIQELTNLIITSVYSNWINYNKLQN